MRVLICGGGIGGLTLAHALQPIAEVTVVDRDVSAAATGGYRLHLNAAACAVLDECLERGLVREIRAVSDGPEHFSTFAITDHRLRPIAVEKQSPTEDRLLCQRVALRTLLATGLERPVLFGRTVRRVRLGPSPAAELDDGTTIEADVLIGAEGASSPTVHALAGHATAGPSGLHGIAGTYALEPGDLVPPVLRSGPAIAVAADGTGLFLSISGGGSRPHLGVALRPPPTLVWGLIARRSALPVALPDDGLGLTAIAERSLQGWVPRIVAMVHASDPAGVASYPFRSVDPRTDLTPWTSGNVTAIGDAVHCMPPTGGQAAATAIRDAGELARQLRAHPSTPDGVRAAIRTYETAMPAWAVPAVRESLVPARIIRALGRPGASTVARVPLSVAAWVGSLRYGHRR